jgi:hypothetical protein
MENSSVWDKVCGFIPGEGYPTLTEMLDQRVMTLGLVEGRRDV